MVQIVGLLQVSKQNRRLNKISKIVSDLALFNEGVSVSGGIVLGEILTNIFIYKYRKIGLFDFYVIIIKLPSTNSMQSSQYKEWLKMSPLLYSYLSINELSEYAAITSAKFPRNQKMENSFKYQSFRVMIAAKSHAGNGVFSVNQVDIPLPSLMGDERLKCQINKKCEISFQNQISCFQEISSGSSEYANDSFIAINQKRHDEINVYSLSPLMSLKEKSYTVKPRVVLSGKEEVTTMKSRKQELLVGRANGEVHLYDLKSNDYSPMPFRYHREAITDICWLSLHEKQEEKLFISASSQNYLYVWDKKMSNPAFKIDHKQKQVKCLEFIKNSCFLSGGSDSSIKCWDIRNNSTQFFTFKDQGAPVQKLCKVESTDPKNERLVFASGGQSGQVLLWENEIELSHRAHSSQIVSLGYNKQYEMFMSVEKNLPILSLWKLAYFSINQK